MIVIGVDVHKHSLTAVAVGELGRSLDEHVGPVEGRIIDWARECRLQWRFHALLTYMVFDVFSIDGRRASAR